MVAAYTTFSPFLSLSILMLRSGPVEADLLQSVPKWLPGADFGGQWHFGHWESRGRMAAIIEYLY